MVGAGTFFRYIWGPNWHWNILDLFVVISSWVEMAVEFASGEARSTNTNLRIVRVLRAWEFCLAGCFTDGLFGRLIDPLHWLALTGGYATSG